MSDYLMHIAEGPHDPMQHQFLALIHGSFSDAVSVLNSPSSLLADGTECPAWEPEAVPRVWEVVHSA